MSSRDILLGTHVPNLVLSHGGVNDTIGQCQSDMSVVIWNTHIL